jgi:hypothetical protein
MATRALRLLAAVPALSGLALGVAACSDDEPSTVERADITTTSRAPVTTDATTTTLSPCPDVDALGGDVEVAPEGADVDGDGEPDELSSASSGGDAWRLQVALGRGGGAVLDLQSFGGPGGILGGADVDADGADEIWARTGAGASATIVGLFVLDGCELARAAFPDGTDVELPVGGTVGTSTGVECADDGGLLVHTATYTGDGGDDRYEVTTVTYDLDDTDLVERERSTAETSAQDPDFVRYTSLSCGDVVL